MAKRPERLTGAWGQCRGGIPADGARLGSGADRSRFAAHKERSWTSDERVSWAEAI